MQKFAEKFAVPDRSYFPADFDPALLDYILKKYAIREELPIPRRYGLEFEKTDMGLRVRVK